MQNGGVQGASAFHGDQGHVYGCEGHECGHGNRHTWIVGHLMIALVVVGLRHWRQWEGLIDGEVHK